MACVKRLPAYLQMLRVLHGEGHEYVSGTVLASTHNLEPVIVRKDLAVTGIIGMPRRGFHVANLIAAQLWERALGLRPDLEEDFARGDFGWLLGWLRENVHAQGRRYDALALVRRITGGELSTRPLIRYLRKRYEAIYL